MRFCQLLILSLIIISCNSNKTQKSEYSDQVVHIISNAGEPYLESSFLASPLVHGVMINDLGDSLDVFVLSRYSPEDKLEVSPLASFQILDGETSKNIVLATPSDPYYKVFKDMDFEEFVIENNAAKVLIDTYYSSYKGQGKTRVVNWANTSIADNMVVEFFNKPNNADEK